MNSEDFIINCKDLIIEYDEQVNLDTDNNRLTYDDIFIVWEANILEDNKAVLDTNRSDGVMYSITYNTISDEYYFTVFSKLYEDIIKI